MLKYAYASYSVRSVVKVFEFALNCYKHCVMCVLCGVREISDPVAFWLELELDVNAVGQSRFKAISGIALAILSLPFSNAAVERVFLS